VTTVAARAAAEKAALKETKAVENRLEVLPEVRSDGEIRQAVRQAVLRYPRYSSFDDRLRYQLAYLIYGDPRFVQYAHRADPPIRIIVDRGHVTLTGTWRARSTASSSATSREGSSRSAWTTGSRWTARNAPSP
jgi:hypothetical protein